MRVPSLAAAAVVLAACAPAPPPSPATVVVVRHAEKVLDGSADPALTAEGVRRAEDLDRVLADAPVVALISTPTRRTRDTLAPLARRTGLPVTEIASDADPVADVVRAAREAGAAGGVVVVSGHSNTVPAIVATLSGRAVPAIDDGTYDDLFVVFRPGSADAGSIHLRYGARSGADARAPSDSERAASVR